MRITTLTTPLGADLTGDILVFREATGIEGMNRLFEYDITMHSATAGITPKTLLGKPMTLSIDDQFGVPQCINGLVFGFESLGGDYRRSLYRAKIAPWLALTKLSADSRIFQNMTVVDIVMQVLGNYPFPVKKKLNDNYPNLVFTVQYNESDFAFVSRLLERFGIGYYFEHTTADHTLVLSDQMSVYTPIAGHETVPYRLMDHMDVSGEENIHGWNPKQSMKPGSYATDDYDYRQPGANFSSMSTGTMDPKQHDYDQLPVYHWQGQGHFNDWDLGERIATLNQDEQQQQYQVIEAESNVRALLGGATGGLFTLTDHPDAAMNREYLIVGSRSHIKENPGTSGDGESQTEWSVTLTLTPSDNQYRPQQSTPQPKIHGPQSAIVDGPDSQEIWTNDLGEVKLRFLWDRYAPGQGKSSLWIRVLSFWSGDGWGSEHLPRIGTEVIVMFLNGNPDHPIVIGRVPHTSQIPPAFSKAGALPGNQALAGIKSKELGGYRYNQMLMDDTNGEIRMQLESEHAKTQLNMGYLVHPRDVSGEPRGEGFELRTDEWGVLRAASGILFSSGVRQDGAGKVMSRDELIGNLEEALTLAKSVGDFAEKFQGNSCDFAPQATLAASARAWDDNANAGASSGEGPSIFAISAPAGIATGTPESTTIAAGGSIDTVAQKNQHINAGELLNLNARHSIAQFAIEGGVKSIAHAGPQTIQAQNDDVQFAANQAVSITSSNGQILIAGKKNVTLSSGGAYIKIADGNIQLHCPGTISIKRGHYDLSGPDSMAIEFPLNQKPAPFSNRLDMYDLFLNHDFSDIRFKAKLNGTILAGNLDEHGRTAQIYSDSADKAKVLVGSQQDEWDHDFIFDDPDQDAGDDESQ